ncbi:hypothetical protein [Paraburkholderia sp.]|jgi:hypothetical protein|uniref:hypothetical protein n=1 Tax=Paraburkholderia sp. TaxID=1926495 RepID=UPI002F3FB4F1
MHTRLPATDTAPDSGLLSLSFLPLLFLLGCLLGGLLTSDVSAETLLNVKTSWIGNTFGYGDGMWTQIDISAIAVAPDGKVYTNSVWDESGAESGIYQDGKMLGRAGDTHGWGNFGGNAVAVNQHCVFIAVTVDSLSGSLVAPGIWPPKGRQWYGVSRRQISDPSRSAPFRPVVNAANPREQLGASFLTINDVVDGTRDAGVGGLAANDTALYVANPLNNRIEVYDAQSMQRKATWNAPEPGRLAVAPDGTVWALTGTRTGKHPRVVHYSASGQRLDDALPLPADTIAVDVAVDPQGRVLIADNGPRQQVLFFARQGDGRYTADGTLGEPGGIFSGVSGRPGPQRFNGLTGVGVDAQGNVYVSNNGLGINVSPDGAGLFATLESYAPDGKLRWQVQGLLFVDGAWIDPARPDSVYTGNKRFELDLSKPSGQDWKYAGFLSNRFRYPQDPTFNTDPWPGMPIARQLKGHTFLYLTDMYADHLKIYRFDAARVGETAIPSCFVATSAAGVAHVPNAPPGGEWIWRDSNGDGKFDAAEFAPNTTGTPMAGGWGWWVDSAGDIWHALYSKGIYRFRFGGLDKYGNPIYSYADMTVYPVPPPFTDLHRTLYIPETDTLYATGYTADMPYDVRFWKEVGRVLVRYDHWSRGKPTPRYTVTVPWQTQTKPGVTTNSITVEGQYVFLVESVTGAVHVLDKDTGVEVGVIRPGPEVGRTSGWVDVPNGVSAYRRSDGEYLVFVEEDARGKVMMYRWKP